MCDKMDELFKDYGYFKEELCTITLKGQDGAKRIEAMMENIRWDVPKEIGGLPVMQFRDYQKDVKIDMTDGKKSITGLPKSNVLYFELEKGAWCCIRPSGTEPKIKFYIGVRGVNEEDADMRLRSLTKALEKLAG